MTWNIRGLGSTVKKRFLVKLIKEGKPDMVSIQETKLESVERIAIQKLWGGTNMEFECSNSVGASGGLLIIWNKDFFKATNVII